MTQLHKMKAGKTKCYNTIQHNNKTYFKFTLSRLFISLSVYTFHVKHIIHKFKHIIYIYLLKLYKSI